LQGTKKKRKRKWEREAKNEIQQKGPPCDQTKGLLLVLFEHLQTPGASPIWVELPKEFYMKNKHKNIKIVKQASLETKIHERMMFAPQANLLHKQLVITQNKHTTTQHLLLNNFCA
jgi:hypothetical protein